MLYTINSHYYGLNEDKEVYSLPKNETPQLLQTTHKRIVAREVVQKNGKKYLVSTMFTGIDFSMGANEKPLVFETAIFDEKKEEVYRTEYSNYEDSFNRHSEIIKDIKTGKLSFEDGGSDN